MKRKGCIYSGTSGLVLPVPRTQYPPAFAGSSRLKYYAHLFNSIEINSTFYKLPRMSTIENWIQTVDDSFIFTFKLPKLISHAKGLSFSEEDVQSFMDLIKSVKQKGCILIQFPPSLKSDRINELKKLLACLQNAGSEGWRIAVEFRDRSWYNETLYEILHANNAMIVMHDLPTAPPDLHSNASFEYLRFHGPGGKYRGSYTNEFLAEYAVRIKRWLNEGKDVFCYFNNTMGDAVANLQTLNELVR